VHEALIQQTRKDPLIGHIARDSTPIEAHEHFPETAEQRKSRCAARKGKLKEQRKAARRAARQAALLAGRPVAKGGAQRGSHRRYPGGKRPYVPAAETRLQRQRTMRLSEMLADLPTQCDIGGKKNSQGNEEYWRGYKLHLDVADGQIPISAVLTSASAHDSQVAIPLATMSTQRVTYFYELMGAAYDACHITGRRRALGHVPIVDPKAPGGPKPEAQAILLERRRAS